MKMFNTKTLCCLLFALFLACPVSAFTIVEHNAESQQKILALDSGDTSTYIYSKSLDFTRTSTLDYLITIKGKEFELLKKQDANAIKQVGFLELEKYEKSVFLVDSADKKIVIGFYDGETFKFKEIEFPDGINFVDKITPTEGGLIFFSNNVWSPSLYYLDAYSGKVSKKDIPDNRGKLITDYLHVDKHKYLMLRGDNGKGIFINIYSEELELINKITYLHKTVILDAKLVNPERGPIYALVGSIDASLWPVNKNASVHKLSLNLKKESAVANELLVVNTTYNPEIIKNIVICENQDKYFWVDRSKEKVHFRSSNGHEESVSVPEGSFPRELFFMNVGGEKSEVFVNFLMYDGAYLNEGFGKQSVSFDCDK
jgi:hypothetical protein